VPAIYFRLSSPRRGPPFTSRVIALKKTLWNLEDMRVSIVMGYPHYSWMVYFMENPNLKWMRTGGSPISEKLHLGLWLQPIPFAAQLGVRRMDLGRDRIISTQGKPRISTLD
jgi:hypothetical protein